MRQLTKKISSLGYDILWKCYYHIWMIMENTQIKIESRVPILENFGCLVNNKEVALK